MADTAASVTTAPVTPGSVTERLVAFVRAQQRDGVPAPVRHEAKRLLLNQLKASVGATTHPAVQLLHAGPTGTTTDGRAHILWFGQETGTEHAAMVNGAMFEVLDFHDTFIETYLHAVSAVLPAVLAAGEAAGSSGADVVDALALGIEVELAVATVLMPTGYFRGFVPLGLVGGVGAATACAILADLDDVAFCHALGLAMCTAGGTYETVGSMGLAWVTAINARNGLDVVDLARRGFTGPRSAFEGDKGMLASYSDESPDKIEPVLASLGTEWRIHRQSYKTVPTETITHGPIDCMRELSRRAGDRQIRHLRFGVSPIVVTIADERFERFGLPSSDLEARFDLRFCAAAAWCRGRFGLEEMQEAAYTDPTILELRGRIELVADESRATFDGCWLEAEFTDGTEERINVDAFLGSPGNPVSDAQLREMFVVAAEGHLPAERAGAVADAALTLDEAKDLDHLMGLCRIEGPGRIEEER